MSVRKRAVLQVLIVCCVCLVARAVYVRRQPERLISRVPMEIFGNIHPPAIYQGNIYWLHSDPDGDAVLSMPVTGGLVRQLVSEKSSYQIMNLNVVPKTAGASLLYTVQWRTKPNVGVSGTSGGPVQYLGTFRMAPQESAAERGAKKERYVNPQGHTTKFIRRVSLSGGPAQDVVPGPVNDVMIADNCVYWTRGTTDEIDYFTLKNQMWSEVKGHKKLYQSPLTGGAARLLRTGLSNSTFYTVRPDGIFWLEPHVFPDRRQDLYYDRIVDGRLYILPNYHEGGIAHDIMPREYRGRQYWFAEVSRPDPRMNIPMPPKKLLSANPDGSDQRTELVLPTAHKQWIDNLFIYRGDLYGMIVEVGGKHAVLCRLHFGRTEPFEAVRTLPEQAGNFQIDAHYLYFTVPEQDRTLMQTLTDDQAMVETRTALYRVDLSQ